MGRFTSRNTTVRFEDAAGIGLTIGPGPGDFTFGTTNKENTEKTRVLDRGVYECHVQGDDLEQEFSITVGLKGQALTSTTLKLVTDFIEQSGTFDPDTGSTPTQSVNPGCDIWSWKTIVTMQLCSTTAIWTLPVCTGGYAFAEAKEGNSISISGANNGKITRS